MLLSLIVFRQIFEKKIEDFDVPNCDEQGGDCLSLRHPSEMGANEREICIEEVGGDCLSLRHPDKMGANTYESPMTPSDSYEDGLPVPDDSAIDSEELPDALPEVTPVKYHSIFSEATSYVPSHFIPKK